MTSDRPYPGQPSGPDGNPQANPNDQVNTGSARPRLPDPDAPLTQFAAFGDEPVSPPAPIAQARAAVRMPPGLITSAAPEASSPAPTPTRGQVYGRPSADDSGGFATGSPAGAGEQPAAYGTPPAPYDRPPTIQSGVYGAPRAPEGASGARVYGQPYAAGADDAPGAQQMAPPRPTVPAQRTPGVYGQRQPGPPEVSERPAVPAQRGRQVAWQDQLEPSASAAPLPAPSMMPPSAPTPADVAVIAAPARRGLKITAYIAIALLIVGLGVGALYYTSRTDPPKVGTCVEHSGSAAVPVSCSVDDAYKVGPKVSSVSDCPDYLNQPSLTYTESGKDVVLCLQPVH